jgi:hypothetical protein
MQKTILQATLDALRQEAIDKIEHNTFWQSWNWNQRFIAFLGEGLVNLDGFFDVRELRLVVSALEAEAMIGKADQALTPVVPDEPQPA